MDKKEFKKYEQLVWYNVQREINKNRMWKEHKDDLFAEGMKGVILALDTFEGDKSSLETWIINNIRWKILSYKRTMLKHNYVEYDEKMENILYEEPEEKFDYQEAYDKIVSKIGKKREHKLIELIELDKKIRNSGLNNITEHEDYERYRGLIKAIKYHTGK